ncbi:MAG: hypothetical protein IH612_19735 [Desulfofustis sp.]|nr:hypothetical protein [Desulfofustis sp.]
MNLKKLLIAAPLVLIASLSGCAYRYYIGMHGPSIKSSPETHLNVTKDVHCLQCHHPAKPTDAPPTSHPHFKGCLGCHDDDIE